MMNYKSYNFDEDDNDYGDGVDYENRLKAIASWPYDANLLADNRLQRAKVDNRERDGRRLYCMKSLLCSTYRF